MRVFSASAVAEEVLAVVVGGGMYHLDKRVFPCRFWSKKNRIFQYIVHDADSQHKIPKKQYKTEDEHMNDSTIPQWQPKRSDKNAASTMGQLRK